MSKIKGTRLERELIHMLHEAGWGIIRSAGSGSTPLPSADILAGNPKQFRHLAIECKALKSNTKYFYPEEIQQLNEFAQRIGAEPWVGIRFNNEPWYFIKPDQLEKTKSNNFALSMDLAKTKGLIFERLIGVQKDLNEFNNNNINKQ